MVTGQSAESILGAPVRPNTSNAAVVQHKLNYDQGTAYLDKTQNSKLSRFGVLTDMQTNVDEVLGSTQIDVVEEIVGGAAAAYQPSKKRVAIRPLPKGMESQKESLNGLDVTDRCITLSHELQHVFDAYDPNATFDERQALQAPLQQDWPLLLRSEWHAHARKRKPPRSN